MVDAATHESYAWCRRVARARARNFYYSFVLLPRCKRDAMCAVYSFMRVCDDLSDEPGARRSALDAWRRGLDRALRGDFDGHPCWPALYDTVRRFGLPPQYLHEMIDGVSSDLDWRPIRTFEELYRYCYLVASVVGLTIIHIFEYSSPEALPMAEKCGVAFQLTNILRDVREDQERGRIYLPEEDLRRFNVDPQNLRYDEHFLGLMRFEAERAKTYYRQSLPLIELVHRDSRHSLAALIAIYRRLLEKIEHSGYDVLSRRIALSPAEKLTILLRCRWRPVLR